MIQNIYYAYYLKFIVVKFEEKKFVIFTHFKLIIKMHLKNTTILKQQLYILYTPYNNLNNLQNMKLLMIQLALSC